MGGKARPTLLGFEATNGEVYMRSRNATRIGAWATTTTNTTTTTRHD